MRSALPDLPEPIAAERRPVAERALRHLPDTLLVALRRGIDRNVGRLRAGGLFSDGGDCPVGVMLRELDPGTRTNRGMFGQLRPCEQSVWREHPELAAAVPRLAHLETWYDVTVRLCGERDPSGGNWVWAQAVGRWLAALTTVELERRYTFEKKSSPSESSSFVASEFSRVYSSV